MIYTELEYFEHKSCIKLMSFYTHDIKLFNKKAAILLSSKKMVDPDYASKNREMLTQIKNYFLGFPHNFIKDTCFDMPVNWIIFGYTIELSDKNLFKLNSNFKTKNDLYQHFSNSAITEEHKLNYIFYDIKQLASLINKFEFNLLFEHPMFQKILNKNLYNLTLPTIKLLKSFHSTNNKELNCEEGDILNIIKDNGDGWLYCQKPCSLKEGYIYVQKNCLQ